ncbi:MAG: bifunctional riboflavin kinase/FAD synthetase [Candidatus Nanopelagicales bacterium]
MNVITGPPRAGAAPSGIVTIGVFDGVHRGHRHLISTARALADERGLPLTVMTFTPHPLSVVRPELAPLQLSTVEQRIELLADAGADTVRVVTFDAATAAMSAQDFVDRYLVSESAVKGVVAGEGFRFGHRAAGDLALLERSGVAAGFTVTAVPLAGDDSAAWSSTRIRELVADGDVATAALGLTRPHRLEGEVVHGDHRGRELGYPTANLAVIPGSCVPLTGVYAGSVVLDPYGDSRRTVPAAISVGTNLTFGGTDPRVEAHIVEPGDWDLYGAGLAVDFTARIRGMVAFDTVAELLDAMAGDVEATRRLMSG